MEEIATWSELSFPDEWEIEPLGGVCPLIGYSCIKPGELGYRQVKQPLTYLLDDGQLIVSEPFGLIPGNKNKLLKLAYAELDLD